MINPESVGWVAAVIALGAWAYLCWRYRAFGPLGGRIFGQLAALRGESEKELERYKAIDSFRQMAIDKMTKRQIEKVGKRWYASPNWADRAQYLYQLAYTSSVLAASPYRSERFFSRLVKWIASADRNRWFSGTESSEIMLQYEAEALSQFLDDFADAFDQQDIDTAFVSLCSVLLIVKTGEIPADLDEEQRMRCYGSPAKELKSAVSAFRAGGSGLPDLKAAIGAWEAAATSLRDPLGYLFSHVLIEHKRTFNIWSGQVAVGKTDPTIQRALIYMEALPEYIVIGKPRILFRRFSSLLSELEIEPRLPHIPVGSLQPFRGVAFTDVEHPERPVLERGVLRNLASLPKAIVVDKVIGPRRAASLNV